MKILGKSLLIMLALVVLIGGGILVKVILFPVNTFVKSVDMAYDVNNKIINGDNAIYNYEWFKQQEATIRTNVKNEQIAKEEWDNFVKALPQDRTAWAREDKDEEASLRNSFYALQKLTNKSMEDYNARSSMVSRNIFKDNLPSNITRAWYAGKELIK